MIHPSERFENYLRSLWNYIDGKFSMTEKYFRGVNTLDTATLTRWVEFAWESSTRTDFRSTDQSYPGSRVHGNLIATIYEKPNDTFLGIIAVRDTLVALLRRAVIEVRDWAGGTNQFIQHLTGERLIIDASVPSEEDINRHVLVFDYCYLEQYDRGHQ